MRVNLAIGSSALRSIAGTFAFYALFSPTGSCIPAAFHRGASSVSVRSFPSWTLCRGAMIHGITRAFFFRTWFAVRFNATLLNAPLFAFCALVHCAPCTRCRTHVFRLLRSMFPTGPPCPAALTNGC